jgi:hypothetical protein
MTEPITRTISLDALAKDLRGSLEKTTDEGEPWFVTDGDEVVAVLMGPEVYENLIDRVDELAGTLESLLRGDPGLRADD